MILYIRDDIKVKIYDWFEDSLLKECSVRYERNDDDTITIKEQKCVLDEWTVNELFDLYLSGYRIEYGANGGAGCDFSLSVYKEYLWN